MEPRGRNRWQLVANAMVRSGSTVRVRQRALQNPRSRGFSVQDDLLFVVRAVGMEPFMELSSTRVGLLRAKRRGRLARFGGVTLGWIAVRRPAVGASRNLGHAGLRMGPLEGREPSA